MNFSTLLPSLGHVLARAVLDVHHVEPELVRLVDLPGQTEDLPVRNKGTIKSETISQVLDISRKMFTNYFFEKNLARLEIFPG